MILNQIMKIFGKKREATMDDKLLDMLMENEGFSGKAYICPAGYLTIGYGHNLDAKPISEKVSRMILQEDIGDAIRDLYGIFPDYYKYSHNRKMALIDLMFNLGMTRLRKFVKFIDAVKSDDWNEAADELIDSEWYEQVGERSPKIVDLIKKG